jgi:23S rRNA G2445 N2-methylase RlmL
VPDEPLRDPVCGSGTLIIEGALMARVGGARARPHLRGGALAAGERDDWTVDETGSVRSVRPVTRRRSSGAT